MSDIMRRVVTIFSAQGADQVRAQLGQMTSGFSSYRKEVDLGAKSTSIINQQMRALGTTIRYAFAGSAVFGTLELVRNLGQFQARLGEIQSIATGSNGLPLLDRQIDQLGQRLIQVSNDTTEPINDLQQGVLNLYSTIGNVPPNKAADMMKEISTVAITSQSNVQDTTQALLGMIDAFGKGTDHIKTYGNEFYKVIQLSAGMTGATYAQQLGRLSSSAALGGFTPEQMGALAIGATRFGGSADSNMNNLSQMMLYLMNPRTNKEKSTLASIGLGPQQRQQLGGYGSLMKLLTAVNQRGGVGMTGAFASADDATLQDMQDNGMSLGAMGAKGGGATLLENAFGRIQSMRIAAILSKLVTPDQVAGTSNKTLDQYLHDVTNSAGDTDKAMARAMDYRRINQASNAVHNMGIEIGTALSPLFNLPARGLTSISEAFSGQNWQVPGVHIPGKTAEVAGGGIGIALLLRQLGRGGSVARKLPIAAAGLDALSSDGTRGSSPLNPLYVAVVYSLANGFGVNPGVNYGIPTRDMRTVEGELGGAGYGGAAGAAAAASRFSKYAPIVKGVGASIGLTYVADQLFQSYLNTRNLPGGNPQGEANYQAAKGNKLLQYLGNSYKSGFRQIYPGHPDDSEMKIIDKYASHKLTSAAAEAALEKIASPAQLKAAGINLKGQADVNVTITDDNGNKLGAAHVTTDLFPDFTPKAPQTKGKPVTRRGGN